MFLCYSCLDDSQRGWVYIAPSSRGPCENCGKTSICYDVPYRGPTMAELKYILEEREGIRKG